MTPLLGIYASSMSQGGPVGAYDSLASIVLSAPTSTVTFAGIPEGYKRIEIHGLHQNTAGQNNVYFRFNEDTSASYTYHYLRGNGSTTTADYGTGLTYAYAGYTSNTTDTYGSSITKINDYSSSVKNKTLSTFVGFTTNGSGTIVGEWSNLWINTNPIYSITIYTNAANFNTYSQFDLIGIR